MMIMMIITIYWQGKVIFSSWKYYMIITISFIFTEVMGYCSKEISIRKRAFIYHQSLAMFQMTKRSAPDMGEING